MPTTPALRGLAQVNIPADDVAAARDWYAQALGVQPYFQQPDAANPAYVEFRLGDHQDELGIIDRRYLPPSEAAAGGGVIARWHVDDLEGMVAHLKEIGATEHEPITPRGDEGFVTASVLDPFGNVLGLIHSPHFIEQL
ncbi:VOC family protein [Citricoccus sp. K5]|uniref:VOC family protein n=1 Tax=Citricoccus sp. K5 TaxID=2653135 RepID=UPI0013576C98|nr:VOC family protein [Citricoccus sp. K5]